MKSLDIERDTEESPRRLNGGEPRRGGGEGDLEPLSLSSSSSSYRRFTGGGESTSPLPLRSGSLYRDTEPFSSRPFSRERPERRPREPGERLRERVPDLERVRRRLDVLRDLLNELLLQ
ncbi:hypothetical protein ACLKA7_003238 [Drosophila subpalustris]